LKLILWRELLFNFKRITLFLAMDNNQVNQAGQINQAPSQNRFSKILGGAGRYLFGLLLLALPILIIILVKGKPLQFLFLAILTPPINLIVAPPIIIGLYFMLSGKLRARLDVTLLILYALLLFELVKLE